MTELLYLADAYLAQTNATVEAVHAGENFVVLNRTVFYATGGGQPHDTGTLAWDGASADVVDVRKAGAAVNHVLAEGSPLPQLGSTVAASIDWERRHELMRTHTAMHILCDTEPRLPAGTWTDSRDGWTLSLIRYPTDLPNT